VVDSKGERRDPLSKSRRISRKSGEKGKRRVPTGGSCAAGYVNTTPFGKNKIPGISIELYVKKETLTSGKSFHLKNLRTKLHENCWVGRGKKTGYLNYLRLGSQSEPVKNKTSPKRRTKKSRPKTKKEVLFSQGGAHHSECRGKPEEKKKK